jgi:aminodeoxyfutalosine deaminase
VADATFLRGLSRARERARETLGVEIAWVFDISRSMRGGETETTRWADYTVGVTIDAMADGVIALGLGGPEVGHSPEAFEKFFERGRAAGLHSYPHAGEHVGPESIRGALETLGAERIALDVCPTSNLRLGVYPSLGEHPLARLRARGVAVTINTDDPALFGTTLNDEVATLADPFGLDVAAIDEILLNGVRHSFLPEARKQALLATYRAELDRLKTA